MVKVGLLSDTHGVLDDKMLGFLRNVDEIWHAGDVGSLEIIDKLNEIAVTRAVYGNIDDAKIRQELSKTEIFKTEGIKAVMTHIGGYPKRYEQAVKQQLLKERPNIFVCGHSHILKVIFDKELNLLHLNPGAAGKYGLHAVRTMLRFTINKDKISDLEVWEYKR